MIMRTSLRSIGNSRGVLIPAAFLSSCQMEGEVDMQLQDGQIILRPVHRAPRAGWFDNAKALQAEAASPELADWAALPPTDANDDAEWTW
jgi:antitoxin MazE